MEINWKEFTLPKRVVCRDDKDRDKYGYFVIEPFERGFGQTMGNALRRILISSIEGVGITSVKIDGVLHEFSTIPGVVEDTTEIIMNLKKVVFKQLAQFEGIKTVYIDIKKREGDVLASDIVTDGTIEILTPNQHIARLSDKVNLHIDIDLRRGKGYVFVERNRPEDVPIGVILTDVLFSPITKVNFTVENTRVGQMTDYERLILEISTNGGISPRDALMTAACILQRHVEIFIDLDRPAEEKTTEEKVGEGQDLEEKLNTKIDDLELSVRSSNCLHEANINTVRDLVVKTEGEILSYRNFGKKSLSEIVKILDSMGLSLGMKLGDS